MENYGFVLATKEEASEMGFNSGTGLFSELYNDMISELKKIRKNTREYGNAVNMNEKEKKYPF